MGLLAVERERAKLPKGKIRVCYFSVAGYEAQSNEAKRNTHVT